METVPRPIFKEETTIERCVTRVRTAYRKIPVSVVLLVGTLMSLFAFVVFGLPVIADMVGVSPALEESDLSEVAQSEVATEVPHSAFGVIESISENILVLTVSTAVGTKTFVLEISPETSIEELTFTSVDDLQGAYRAITQSELRSGDSVAVYTDEVVGHTNVQSVIKIIKTQ